MVVVTLQVPYATCPKNVVCIHLRPAAPAIAFRAEVPDVPPDALVRVSHSTEHELLPHFPKGWNAFIPSLFEVVQFSTHSSEAHSFTQDTHVWQLALARQAFRSAQHDLARQIVQLVAVALTGQTSGVPPTPVVPPLLIAPPEPIEPPVLDVPPTSIESLLLVVPPEALEPLVLVVPPALVEPPVPDESQYEHCCCQQVVISKASDTPLEYVLEQLVLHSLFSSQSQTQSTKLLQPGSVAQARVSSQHELLTQDSMQEVLKE